MIIPNIWKNESHVPNHQPDKKNAPPLFSAQKPLEPPAASSITGVTQVSTMMRMAKKQSKLNLGKTEPAPSPNTLGTLGR